MIEPPGQGLARFMHQLVTPAAELVSEELLAKALASGIRPLADYGLREVAILTGTLASITVHPKTGERWLEAELSDGSGSVVLVWMGRHRIPGLEAGRGINVRGRLTLLEGRKAIFNPYYELIA